MCDQMFQLVAHLRLRIIFYLQSGLMGGLHQQRMDAIVVSSPVWG